MFADALFPDKLVNHMAAIKPIVPQTLIGGNTLITSKLFVFKILYATELDSEMVGI